MTLNSSVNSEVFYVYENHEDWNIAHPVPEEYQQISETFTVFKFPVKRRDFIILPTAQYSST